MPGKDALSWLAGAVGAGLLLATLLSACDTYTPEPVDDALIQLAFEGDLNNVCEVTHGMANPGFGGI